MAKVGLRKLTVAVLDPETGEYSAPFSLGKAVSSTVTPNSADAKLYAEDGVAESDSSFVNATVSVAVDDSRDATVLAPLLGHTVGTGEQAGEVLFNKDDQAPYFGMGQIVPKVLDGVRKYKVEFLTKTKFKEPTSEATTKADNVEFKTTSLEGEAIANDAGLWKKSREFATEAEAQTYLDACFGVEAGA